MKRILLFLMTLITAASAWSQQTYTWNKPNGAAWNTANNWTPSRSMVRTTDILIINTGTSMTITAFPNASQTVGKLSILGSTIVTFTGTNGNLTINGGTGTDLTIDDGATLSFPNSITMGNAASGSIAGTLNVPAGETFEANNTTVANATTIAATGKIVNRGTVSGSENGLRFLSGATYEHARDGGSIPTADWDPNSNCNITGITNSGPSTASFNQDFGNLTWNSPSQNDQFDLDAELENVYGDLNIVSTGTGNVRLKDEGRTSATTLVRGNFNLSGGTLYIIGEDDNQTLSVRGNVNISGGTLRRNGGNGTFTFSGTNVQTFTKTGGTVTSSVAFTIANNAIVDFGNYVLDGTQATFNLNNGGKIITSNAAGLSSNGSTGSIQVGGSRTYSSGADYEFRGASTGTFTTNGNQEMHDLTINNTSGNVVLFKRSIVEGNLALINGYLTTTPTISLTLSTDASASTANGSFVNGPLVKEMDNSSTFTFPVGTTDGGLRTIGMTTNSGTGTSTFTARFFSSNARAAFPNATLAVGISRVSGCEYWTLTRSGGSRTGRVTLSWTPASSCTAFDYITAPGTLKVARQNGAIPGIWTDAGLSASNSQPPFTTGTITSNNLATTAYGPFAIGTTDISANPLPVLFDEVKAYARNSGVQVEWSNLTERDLIRYEVERSATGTDYGAIATQLPTNNLDDKASYTYFDAAPLQGTSFYRIKVYEKSGKVIYSKVLRIEIGLSVKGGLSLYPNPVTGKQLTIGLTGVVKGQYSLRVINTAGQDVYKSTITTQGSGITQMIELPASVKPGVYTTIVSGGTYRESKVFIVQ